MSHSNRRAFVLTLVAGGGAVAASRAFSQAAAPAALSESDPQAAALGYKADNTKVDKTKFPQHAPGQMCGGCNFFQGKPADATGPCQLFAGKLVASKGWCSAYSKRA